MKRRRRRRTDDGKDDVLRDGETHRVPMMMMDHRRTNDEREVIHDGRGDSGLALHRPGFRISDTADVEAALAMKDYIEELSTAYKRDALPAGAYPLSAGVGSACTVDGAPGELVRQGDYLICKPVRQDAGSTRDERADAYRARDEYLSNAWKGRGR